VCVCVCVCVCTRACLFVLAYTCTYTCNAGKKNAPCDLKSLIHSLLLKARLRCVCVLACVTTHMFWHACLVYVGVCERESVCVCVVDSLLPLSHCVAAASFSCETE